MTDRELTFGEALREALGEEMARDDKVFIFGEDVRYHYYREPTRGLMDKFGKDRVINTPIAESSIVGASVGAALAGLRPVAEIMYAEFLAMAMNFLANYAPSFAGRTSGKATVPLVVRTRYGRGAHRQNFEAWFAHVPGMKVVMPSTPYDAKGLMKSAIRDDNPVLFYEHAQLYSTKGQVPSAEYTVPLGKADVKRQGRDVTVVATGLMVQRSLSAADKLSKEGIDVEIVDLRTVKPLDIDTVKTSVRKTRRLVVVHEAWLTGGIGGEVVSRVAEDAELAGRLLSPPCRVGALDIPLHDAILDHMIPSEARIAEAVKKVVGT